MPEAKTWEGLITQTGRVMVGDGTSLPVPRPQAPGAGHGWFRDALEMQLVAATPRPQASMRTVPSEDDEQRALFAWRALVLAEEPLLDLLHHIPNGKKRSRAAAGQLKAMGVKKTVPDLFLSVARHGFHGLYIELKALDGTVPKEQKALHARLREQGYAVVVAWGWLDAARELCRYLGRADLSRQLGEAP